MNAGSSAVAATGNPLPREEVASFPLDDEVVLYEPASAQTYVLNATGAYVWHLCDGSRTLESIAGLVAEHFGIDHARALQDASTLLDDLQRAGLLKFET
jgi:PqqD family protein of HPr-rel-A system